VGVAVVSEEQFDGGVGEGGGEGVFHDFDDFGLSFGHV
jgi:hypothetical protein